MSENIPYKRGKEDMPMPGLTAAKAMAEALKSVENRQNVENLKNRKHGRKVDASAVEMPKGKSKDISADDEDLGEQWGHHQDHGE